MIVAQLPDVPLSELLQFFLPMLLTCAALALACSTTGVFVLLRREAMIALILPEAVVIGASLAMLAHSESRTLFGAAALLISLPLLAWTRHRRFDHLLPAVYVAGMCVPFLVIASHGGEHLGELQKMFIGNAVDVAVTPDDARRAIPTVLISALIVVALWRRWLLLAQSPTTAQLASMHPAWWDLLFLILTGAVVLMGTTTMGVVMVLALLFLPAAAALPWARRIPTAILLSCIIGLFTAATGFYLSNLWNWPFSQTVGGIGIVLVLLSQIGWRVRSG